jgi:hypothetical protein
MADASQVLGAGASEGAYQALSFAFALRTDRRDRFAQLDRFLSGFRVPPDEARGYVTTYDVSADPSGRSRICVDDELAHETLSDRGVVSWLLFDVHARAMATERSLLVLHAGAVSWHGRGIVMPAAPDSGKSTTVAGLTRAGFDYLSDEASVIDPATLELLPYPRAIRMERSSVEAVFDVATDDPPGRFGKFYHLAPDDIRRGSIGGPCPVRFVVAPMFDASGGTTLEPMSRAEGLVTLAENALNLKSIGSPGFRVLERLLADVACYRLRIADLGEGVDLVSRLVGRT